MNIPKTYLTEAYEVDTKSILKILTQSESGNTNDTHYTELAKWAVDKRRQSKITDIELNDIKISDKSLIGSKLSNRYDSLGSLLNTLNNLMKQEGKYGKNKELSDQIQKITLEILEDLKAKEDSNKQPKEESSLYEGMDWTAEKAKRLAEARDSGETISEVLDKFYNDYYSVEYAGGTDGTDGKPDIVDKLKSLDKILIPEFNKLGYNPDVNPFAAFLKILIGKKPDIFNKLTFNTYGALHNSFIEKNITGNMLGNFSENNILFCEDLYNKNGLDIVEYLSLHKDAAAAVEKSNKYSVLTINKLFLKHTPLDKDFAKNVEKLFDENTDAIVFTDKSAELRSLLEIQELYQKLFGVNAKKKVDIKEVVKKAIDKKVILSMIQYLIDQSELKRTYKEFVVEIKKWLTALKYRRNENENNIEKAEDILSEYRLDANTEHSLVLALQNYYNKNIRDKKAE